MAPKSASERVQERLEKRIDPEREPEPGRHIDPVPGKRLAAKVVETVKKPVTGAVAEAQATAAAPPPMHPAAAAAPTATTVRRVTVRRPKPKPEPPEVILVRAIERGQYGLDVGIIIRNPGEVFEMATSAMRKFPLGPKEVAIEDAVIIETERGQFELPGWVELVDEDEATDENMESRGHARKFMGQTTEKGRSIDVL